MGAPDCIFCSIVSKQIKATYIGESQNLIVIKDINPQAPVHYLVIPKKHIPDVRFLSHEDAAITSELFYTGQELSQALVQPGDFKLQINNGARAGQHVFHLHMHFLAGY